MAEINRDASIGVEPWFQNAARQCTTFRGTFSAEAARAVLKLEGTGDSPAFETVLGRLTEHGVLEPVACEGMPEPFYRQITGVRNSGVHALGTGTSTASAEGRHTQYYAQFAEQWRVRLPGRDGLEARMHLSAELDNLERVHQRALERTPDGSDAATALLMASVSATLLLERGPYARAERLLSEALDASVMLSAPLERVAEARLMQSRVERCLGRLDVALGKAQAAGKEARLSGALETEVRASLEEAAVLTDLGQAEAAQRICARALALAREVELPDLVAEVRARWAVVLMKTGRQEQASRMFLEAVDHMSDHGLVMAEERSQIEMGRCLLESARPAVALRHLVRASTLAAEAHDRAGNAISKLFMGQALHELGRVAEAELWLHHSVDSAQKLGSGHWEGLACTELGGIAAEAGHLENAQVWLRNALSAFPSYDRYYRAVALAELGGIHARRGDLDAAQDCLRDVMRVSDLRPTESALLHQIIELNMGHIEVTRSLRAQLRNDPLESMTLEESPWNRLQRAQEWGSRGQTPHVLRRSCGGLRQRLERKHG